MIRTIDIKLNAAHPELPLIEAATYVGSPSTAIIRGVPPAVGSWHITAVKAVATYPDNSAHTVSATSVAEGVWVVSLPTTDTSGRVSQGLQILADGVDERGEAVTGYVLGIADLAVYSRDMTIESGGTLYYMHYFDEAPATPKKGDVALVDGVLSLYTGTAWIAFDVRAYTLALETAQSLATNYYTAAQTDAAIDRLAAYYITYNAAGAPFPTAAALLNATTVYSGGVVRTPTRNDYAVVLADETHDGAEWRYIYAIPDGSTTGQWEAQYPIETNDYTALANKPQINGHILTGNQTGASLGLLDLSGGTMTGSIIGIRTNNDANREASLAKINLAAAGVMRKGAGKFGICIGLKDGTEREASLYIDDDGKVYINTPNGYVEIPDATNGGTLALTAGTGHAGNLAALDAQGNPTDSTIPAASIAPLSALPYSLTSPTVSGTPETCQLVDRAVNSVTLATAAFAPTFPAATTNRARDFFIRITATNDVTITLPQGVTVENADGDIPAIECGATTLLYFSEVATNCFLLKGEAVQTYTAA